MDIPPAVVEAAAEAIESTLMRAGLGPAAVLREAVFTGLADDALAAALSVGEVRQKWQVISVDEAGHRDRIIGTYPTEHIADMALDMALANRRNVRKQTQTVVTWPDGTVITTPWRSDGE